MAFNSSSSSSSLTGLEIVRRQSIVVNSQNRQSGTISNCTFEFPISVSAQDRVEKIHAIPTMFVSRRSWPAVDDANNSFRLITNPLLLEDDPLTLNGDLPSGYSAADVVVAPGNYNVRTFLRAIQIALPIDWFVSWDSVNNKYTFVPPNDNTEYGFRFPSYLCFQCGFPYAPATIYLLSHASPLTSHRPAQMTIESILLVNTSLPIVHASNLDNFGMSNDGAIQDSVALIKVPVTMPFYDILEWRSHDVELQRKPLANQHITRMEVNITDEYGRMLAMTSDWTLSIVIEYWAPTAIIDIASDVVLIKTYLHYLALAKMGRGGDRVDRDDPHRGSSLGASSTLRRHKHHKDEHNHHHSKKPQN
jgi:hypothetical protein